VSKKLEITSGVDVIYIRMYKGHEQKHRINMLDHFRYKKYLT
jgi:hypothetical protein